MLAHELQENATNYRLDPATIFAAVSGVHRRCRGAYAVVAMIAGYGLLAFRDRLRHPARSSSAAAETERGYEYMVASESVALDTLGFQLVRDVGPGEAIFIDQDGMFYSQQCVPNATLNPCIFEFVYLARPDSVIDGISVYETRLRMGESLADKIRRQHRHLDIDVVIPIPDSSRPSAMELSKRLNLPYREGFIKNRYIGRTFIMPGQAIRRKSVRQKLNAIEHGVQGQERAARGRFDRARQHQPGDRADGARGGRAQGVLRLGRAAGAPPQRLRHRHAHARGADRLRAAPSPRSRARSAATS